MRIPVFSYKLHWLLERNSGGVSVLLDDTEGTEVQIPASSLQELAALGQLLSTFKQIFYYPEEKSIATGIFETGTIKI